jgi:PAS domain S-box-containing protein
VNILIVDDDEDSRVFLERELRGQHYSTESAANGVEALEKAYQWHPDLIISDILMPEMNGFELCRMIKTDEQLRNIPFIFYTATFVDQKDEKLAMSLGASRFLIKPVEPADFSRIIGEVINQYEKNKLSVPDQPLAEMKDLCQMQMESLARKLDKKVQELDKERKTLREREWTFRYLFESSHDVILFTDRAGNIMNINPRAEQLTGYTQSELSKMNIFDDLIIAEDHSMIRKVIQDIFEGRSQTYVERWKTKEGEIIWFEGLSVPRLSPNGEVLSTFCTLRDITDRKRAEEELRKSECKFRELFDSTLDGVYQTDANGVFTMMNRAGATILGYKSPEEIIGSNVLEYWRNPKNRAAFLSELKSRKSVSAYPVESRRKNGDPIQLELSSSIIEDEKGNLLGVEGILRDVTERKELEEQLLQAQKMEAVGQLAGGIAHDFNNILTAIIGFCYMLEKQSEQSIEAQEFINDIHKAANRAADLTNGLLAFSRKQVLTVRPININETIENLEKILRRVIGEDIEIIILIYDENIIINADKAQLEHVLINLATNARDAMPDGGTLTIATSTVQIGEELIGEKPGPYAVIAVSDTGTGISKDLQSRIFEPFFTTKEVGKGTGLGLATVYGVVKQHGGFINLYSEPGAGSTFKIYLPLCAGQTAKTSDESISSPKGGNETILLVEDEPFVRKVITGLLHNAGYSVFEAADGDEALGVFKENPGKIQMVILDVIMPKRGGREVYEELKRTCPEIKVLFMSGYSGDVLSRSGIPDEQLNFIPKPVEPDQLLIKIRQILDA